jgi:signal peptidase II
MLRRRLCVFACVLVSCVGCDHAAKQAAEQWLADGGGLSLLAGVVQLQLVANPGAFLSLGAGLPEALRHFLLIGLAPLALALVSCWVWRSPGASRTQTVALGLVAGGGLANWLDRVLDDGAVTDFVSLGLGPLRTGIFNLADVAIVAGVLALLRAGASSRSGASGAALSEEAGAGSRPSR